MPLGKSLVLGSDHSTFAAILLCSKLSRAQFSHAQNEVRHVGIFQFKKFLFANVQFR